MNLEQWLDLYASSHTNPTNKLIHKICVPLIVWSVLALAYSIPNLAIGPVQVGLFHIIVIGGLYFYFNLGKNVGMAMVAMISFCFLLLLLIEQTSYLWQIALVVFVISWIFQFYGHHVEKKRPSFADDLKFLLVGPLWVMRYMKII